MIKKLFEQPASAVPVNAAAPDAKAPQPETKIIPTDLLERRRFLRPLPLPEVREGDGSQDDWDTWVKLTQEQGKP